MSKTDSDRLWAAFNDFHFFCDTARFQKVVARVELGKMVSDVPGDIVDCGAYKGVSTLEFAHLLKIYEPHSRAKVISCDTFEATFPHAREDELAAVNGLMASYEENAYDNLKATLKRLDLEHRVSILKGDILETIPAYLDANPGFRIKLLHCDLDVYAPTLATLKTVWDRVVPGGIIVFDEYAIENWGESDAVDEFFQTLEKPPRLKTLSVAPTPTAYCIKGE